MSKSDKQIYIETGSYMGFDGSIHSGFPLTKTNISHKPHRDEVRCSSCGGSGWDADCGGPFICPRCKGSGCVPNRRCSKCGHPARHHYI